MKGYKELLKLTIVISGVVVDYLYKPPNNQFELPALDHIKLSHIVIGDFNSQSTSWGYDTADDNGEASKRHKHTRGEAVTVVWQTLCKLCRPLPPPSMGGPITVFWASQSCGPTE